MQGVAIDKNKLTENITVVKKMRDYSKEPFFVKKAEEAMALIKKYGPPTRVKKRK